jgi:hypothetical protein
MALLAGGVKTVWRRFADLPCGRMQVDGAAFLSRRRWTGSGPLAVQTQGSVRGVGVSVNTGKWPPAAAILVMLQVWRRGRRVIALIE